MSSAVRGGGEGGDDGSRLGQPSQVACERHKEEAGLLSSERVEKSQTTCTDYTHQWLAGSKGVEMDTSAVAQL